MNVWNNNFFGVFDVRITTNKYKARVKQMKGVGRKQFSAR